LRERADRREERGKEEKEKRGKDKIRRRELEKISLKCKIYALMCIIVLFIFDFWFC